MGRPRARTYREMIVLLGDIDEAEAKGEITHEQGTAILGKAVLENAEARRRPKLRLIDGERADADC